MKIGERVWVATALFEGMATIIYIASPKELFPVQVELDESDENGHKIFRVAANEIMADHPGEVIGDKVYYSNENPDIEPYIEPIKLKRFVAEVTKKNNSFLIGERIIVSDIDETGYFHAYLLKKPHNGPVGSYMRKFYAIIEPYEDVPTKTHTMPHIDVSEPVETNTPTEPKNAKNKAKKPKYEQTTIFDFLGV